MVRVTRWKSAVFSGMVTKRPYTLFLQSQFVYA